MARIDTQAGHEQQLPHAIQQGAAALPGGHARVLELFFQATWWRAAGALEALAAAACAQLALPQTLR